MNRVDGVEQVVPEVAEDLSSQGVVLVDVREQSEWDAGHAPAATHVPMSQIADAHAGVLARENRVVVICRSGHRSQRVAQFLQQAGYDAANLAGGMQAWATSGRDVVTDAGAPGHVI